MTRAQGAFVAVALVLGLAAPAGAASVEHARRLIEEQRMAEAHAEVEALVKARPHDGDVAFVDGSLLFHEGEYARAAERLAEALPKLRPGSELSDETRGLRELARATEAATHGYVSARGGHFVIRHAPGKDAILVPYALAALESAYAALGDDFGYRPADPIRVEIYPEVADLAKVSTLTLKEIETSGTIALCKFNRLMIVSPRALLTGYPWLDTLTHEYTHFIVARVSHNTVPIWLHEGLAKFEEQRWRGAAGSGLTPMMEHLLAAGLAQKHLITFAEMHPSMAKLPSQKDTALAFAEVYMVIAYLHEKLSWSGVQQIVAKMRDGKSDAEAVASVTGRSFDDFQRDWRTWLHGRKLRLRPGITPTGLRFKRAPGKPTEASEDDAGEISEERARRFARLGGLLRARHRLQAAAVEYEKAQALLGSGHPSVANKLARTYLELGDLPRAIATAEAELQVYPDQAAPNAVLGAAWMLRGDGTRAQPYLEAAIAVSPFDPAVHCDLAKAYLQHNDHRAEAEERACQSLRGP